VLVIDVQNILPSIFVNCALYLSVSSRLLRSYSTRFTADFENANESLHNVIAFHIP